MSQCPYCDAPLTSAELAGRLLDACPQCGGMWLGAADLAEVVKSHPELLAPFDDRYRDRGGRPPLDRPEPICARCHEPLTEKRFPNAPDVPVLACAECRMLFLRDGQLREFHALASPSTLPPELPLVAPAPMIDTTRAVIEEEENEPALHEWTRTNWPERPEGQPWLVWAVVGMPLWAVGAMLLLPGLILGVSEAVGEEGAAWMVPIGILAAMIFCAVQSLGMTVGLKIVWLITGGEGLTFGTCYRWMLPVVATTLGANAMAGGLLAVTHAPLVAHFLCNVGIRLVTYRVLLELDWEDLAVLTLVATALSYVFGIYISVGFTV